MLGSTRKSSEQLQAAERVKRWTRERFELAADVVVIVSENASGLPGCPPLETHVAFWTAEQTRHHFKVFKPVREVLADDLPPAWLKDALAVGEGLDCGCC